MKKKSQANDRSESREVVVFFFLVFCLFVCFEVVGDDWFFVDLYSLSPASSDPSKAEQLFSTPACEAHECCGVIPFLFSLCFVVDGDVYRSSSPAERRRVEAARRRPGPDRHDAVGVEPLPVQQGQVGERVELEVPRGRADEEAAVGGFEGRRGRRRGRIRFWSVVVPVVPSSVCCSCRSGGAAPAPASRSPLDVTAAATAPRRRPRERDEADRGDRFVAVAVAVCRRQRGDDEGQAVRRDELIAPSCSLLELLLLLLLLR